MECSLYFKHRYNNLSTFYFADLYEFYQVGNYVCKFTIDGIRFRDSNLKEIDPYFSIARTQTNYKGLRDFLEMR